MASPLPVISVGALAILPASGDTEAWRDQHIPPGYLKESELTFRDIVLF